MPSPPPAGAHQLISTAPRTECSYDAGNNLVLKSGASPKWVLGLQSVGYKKCRVAQASIRASSVIFCDGFVATGGLNDSGGDSRAV